MSSKIEKKREREKQMVSQMIALYCKKQHHSRSGLCKECAALDAYARMRSEKCPFMDPGGAPGNPGCHHPGGR